LGIGRVVALLAATSAFLLALAGTSFADESGSISYNGASASVSVALGALGGGASIRATDIEVTKSGCYYIKYKLYVQNGFDDGGNHLAGNFCYGDGTTWQSKNATPNLLLGGVVPWVEYVAVQICQNKSHASDPCGDAVKLTAGGRNPLRPGG
jgi:hypothetical protein